MSPKRVWLDLNPVVLALATLSLKTVIADPKVFNPATPIYIALLIPMRFLLFSSDLSGIHCCMADRLPGFPCLRLVSAGPACVHESNICHYVTGRVTSWT